MNIKTSSLSKATLKAIIKNLVRHEASTEDLIVRLKAENEGLLEKIKQLTPENDGLKGKSFEFSVLLTKKDREISHLSGLLDKENYRVVDLQDQIKKIDIEYCESYAKQHKEYEARYERLLAEKDAALAKAGAEYEAALKEKDLQIAKLLKDRKARIK